MLFLDVDLAAIMAPSEVRMHTSVHNWKPKKDTLLLERIFILIQERKELDMGNFTVLLLAEYFIEEFQTPK